MRKVTIFRKGGIDKALISQGLWALLYKTGRRYVSERNIVVGDLRSASWGGVKFAVAALIKVITA